MSETDKYVEAWIGAQKASEDGMGNKADYSDYVWGSEAAAAYLRERFVTREEYEAGTSARIAQVEALAAERDRLRAALEPFAACMEYISDDEDDEEWAKFRLLVKDYRSARKALNPEDV